MGVSNPEAPFLLYYNHKYFKNSDIQNAQRFSAAVGVFDM